MEENTNNLEILDNITKELEKNSKYSYSYISKKKKEGKVTIFFFNSFLITITNEIIHMHQYNKLLYIINNKKNFIIGIPNHTLLINKDEIEKELCSYLLDLQKDYKLIEHTIEYDESEKDNIWNKLDSCIKNYKIKTYNMIDEDSLKKYFKIRRIKIINIVYCFIWTYLSSQIIVYLIFYAPVKDHYDINAIIAVFIAVILFFPTAYEKYINNNIMNIIKKSDKGELYIYEKKCILKTIEDIIIVNNNRIITYNNNDEICYYIKYHYYSKMIIVKKEELTQKEKKYIEGCFNKTK